MVVAQIHIYLTPMGCSTTTIHCMEMHLGFKREKKTKPHLFSTFLLSRHFCRKEGWITQMSLISQHPFMFPYRLVLKIQGLPSPQTEIALCRSIFPPGHHTEDIGMSPAISFTALYHAKPLGLPK